MPMTVDECADYVQRRYGKALAVLGGEPWPDDWPPLEEVKQRILNEAADSP